MGHKQYLAVGQSARNTLFGLAPRLNGDRPLNMLISQQGKINHAGKIDAGTLRLLSNDEISQLIPVPGDRARFKANLENWKTELKDINTDFSFNATNNLPTLSISDYLIDDPQSFLDIEPLTSQQPVAVAPSLSSKPCNETLTTLASTSSRPVPSCNQDRQNQPASESVIQPASQSESQPASQLLPGNRTSTPIQASPLQSDYVLQTLKCTHDGNAILKQGQKSGKLDDTQRNLLVKLIIGPLFEKNPNIVISNNQLFSWALEIQEIFPNESAALYYTPYVCTLIRNTARNASGKLLRYVYNRRRQLRQKGIIEGSSRSRSSSTSSHSGNPKSALAHLKGNTDLEEVEEKLAFLKSSLEPWHLVEEYWTATANYRLIKNYSESGTLQEYFNAYPVLKQPAGYNLLLQDFDILHKDKSNALFLNIVTLQMKVIELARKKVANIRDKHIKQTIESYLSAVTGRLAVIMFSVCTVVLGIILSFVPWLDYLIFRELKLWNGSLSYSYWHKPGVQRYTKVYIFNVTNPQAFLENGEKPRLVEVGPFVYREDMEKVNIKFHDNDTVTYQHNKILRFVPEMSVDKSQKLVVPNIPLLTVTSFLANSFGFGFGLNFGFVAGLKAFNREAANPFVRVTAEELVFGYNDPLVSIAHIVYPQGMRPNKQMGLLLARNGTLDEISTIYTGQKSMHRFGYLDKVNGMDHLPHWKEKPCNNIRASEGSFFPPRDITGSDIVHIYDKDLCRILPLQYQKEVYKDGIRTGLYTPPESTFECAEKNHDNKCYCPNEKCPPKGLQNISPCQYNAPVYLSFPHFLDADPSLLTHFEGLKPNREKHQTYFMIQPKIGVPVEGFVRVQLNLQVKQAHNAGINNINKFPSINFPVMWIEEGIHEITPSIWRWIYIGTTVAPVAAPIITYSMIIFGLLILVYVFIKSYKSLVIGQNSIEIVEIGRETIRRGSTMIINGSHRLLPSKETSHQPYQPLHPTEQHSSEKEFTFLRRAEISQSLDELKGRYKNEFVKSDFDFAETDRESLIHSDNSFIMSEVRRCSMLNLRDYDN